MGKDRSEKCQHVPTILHWQALLFHHTRPVWKWLAGLESAVLREEFKNIPIDRPIYITGVPRAGSTLLTEILARHPHVTSHRYSDFPNVYTPFWRNWLAQRVNKRPARAVERAHRDRIKVTSESPEAVEEVIWMHFFDHLHDPTKNQVLDAMTQNPEFEQFYRDHIRKLLLVRKRERYLAKGNYNVARISFIKKLFPDAVFIIPVRNPINQIASLIKQDRLFNKFNRQDQRVDRQLRMSGHFEFGPGRRPIHIGNGESAKRIEEQWEAGLTVAGWATYWQSIYQYILDQVKIDEAPQSRIQFVRYEDLCQDPETTLRHVLDHAGLYSAQAELLVTEYADCISEPDYYEPDFSQSELNTLIEITGTTAARLGYGN